MRKPKKLIKSPLRYPGGKSKLVKIISKYIPRDYKEFREPFFGGGSVSFYAIQAINPNATYKASDLNYDLVCFWTVLKEKPYELVEAIRNVKENFRNGYELFNIIMARRNRNLDTFQRAIDLFVLNRITYSGTVDSGGYSEQAFKKRFTDSSINRLLEAAKIIKKIDIIHADYEILLKEPGEDVFIYLDPPYYSKSKSKLYGIRGSLHTNFNHEKLANVLSKIKHKWLLSYDDCEYIRKLYSDFEIVTIEVTYGTGSNKRQKEILIANYDLVEVFLQNESRENQSSEKEARELIKKKELSKEQAVSLFSAISRK